MNPEEWYILGLILSDCHLCYDEEKYRYVIALGQSEEHLSILKEFKRIMEKLEGKRMRIKLIKKAGKQKILGRTVNCQNFYRTYIYGKVIAKKWKKRKESFLKKKLSPETEEEICSFVRGFFDGDGSITDIRWLRFHNNSKNILDIIEQLLKRVGLTTTESYFWKQPKPSKNWILQYNLGFITHINFFLKVKPNKIYHEVMDYFKRVITALKRGFWVVKVNVPHYDNFGEEIKIRITQKERRELIPKITTILDYYEMRV